MIIFKQYDSNPVLSTGLADTIRQVIKKLGYRIPLDEADDVLRKVLELPLTQRDTTKRSDTLSVSASSRYDYVMTPTGRPGRVLVPGQLRWSTYMPLTQGHGVCVLTLEAESERRTRIELSTISTFDASIEANQIMESLQKAVKGLKEWEESIPENTQFKDLAKEFSPPKYTNEELRATSLLRTREVFQTLSSVKSSGGSVLKRDIAKRVDGGSAVDQITTLLLDHGLLCSEFVIICKRTSEQVNRVPNEEAYRAMAALGIRCKCGKLISEERLEEILVTTDLAVQLLDKSRWMTILLVQTLAHLGVREQDILVNVNDGPEEIDAFAVVGEDLLMFELKDSQFSMGHAYAFAGRLGLYEPEHGIIVASGGVAPEVKEHFRRVQPDAEIHYVEGLNKLEDSLSGIITQVTSDLAIQALGPLRLGVLYNIPFAILESLKSRAAHEEMEVAASLDPAPESDAE